MQQFQKKEFLDTQLNVNDKKFSRKATAAYQPVLAQQGKTTPLRKKVLDHRYQISQNSMNERTTTDGTTLNNQQFELSQLRLSKIQQSKQDSFARLTSSRRLQNTSSRAHLETSSRQAQQNTVIRTKQNSTRQSIPFCKVNEINNKFPETNRIQRGRTSLENLCETPKEKIVRKNKIFQKQPQKYQDYQDIKRLSETNFETQESPQFTPQKIDSTIGQQFQKNRQFMEQSKQLSHLLNKSEQYVTNMNSPKQTQDIETAKKQTDFQVKKSISHNNLHQPKNYHDQYLARLDQSAHLGSKTNKKITAITSIKMEPSSKHFKEQSYAKQVQESSKAVAHKISKKVQNPEQIQYPIKIHNKKSDSIQALKENNERLQWLEVSRHAYESPKPKFIKIDKQQNSPIRGEELIVHPKDEQKIVPVKVISFQQLVLQKSASMQKILSKGSIDRNKETGFISFKQKEGKINLNRGDSPIDAEILSAGSRSLSRSARQFTHKLWNFTKIKSIRPQSNTSVRDLFDSGMGCEEAFKKVRATESVPNLLAKSFRMKDVLQQEYQDNHYNDKNLCFKPVNTTSLPCFNLNTLQKKNIANEYQQLFPAKKRDKTPNDSFSIEKLINSESKINNQNTFLSIIDEQDQSLQKAFGRAVRHENRTSIKTFIEKNKSYSELKINLAPDSVVLSYFNNINNSRNSNLQSDYSSSKKLVRNKTLSNFKRNESHIFDNLISLEVQQVNTGKKLLKDKNMESSDFKMRHGKKMDYQQISNTQEKIKQKARLKQNAFESSFQFI